LFFIKKTGIQILIKPIFINMGQLDKNIFGSKKFSDILEEIYNNQKKKEEQISTLISELKPLIQDIGDATLVVPLLKEYLEISVKNDEQLIKMATIIQRAVQSDGGDDDNFGMTEAEKQQLLDEVKKYGEDKKK
tara:strand:+ start:467 stop:868 length:402 start_codon:yes stop_codon:yes gene_type:complete